MRGEGSAKKMKGPMIKTKKIADTDYVSGEQVRLGERESGFNRGRAKGSW